MRVLIGYDSNEHEAAMVAAKSLRDVTCGQIEPEFLVLPKLVDQGLITRLGDERGQRYDLVSNAPMSTQFAISRFLTPIICQQGYALFCDCDVVFLRDPRVMLKTAQARHALNVAWHEDAAYPIGPKMVGQQQTHYPRKNASSVMLFNCDHGANRRLSLRDVNERPGCDLHALYWLNDDEIGALDGRWNWLVDVEPRPTGVGIAHMTLGGPWIDGWRGGSFDDEWKNASRGMLL